MENTGFTVTDNLLASKGERFLNCIIDLVIQYSIALGIGQTIFIIADVTKGYGLADRVKNMSSFEYFLFGLIILFFYYILTETYFSRSFAKYFTKTLVVMRDGSKPTNRVILKRTLCRLIPFEAFSFLGANPRGWHDTFSHTYVVKKHAFNDKKRLFFPPDQVGDNLI